jgi:hypothetical protein
MSRRQTAGALRLKLDAEMSINHYAENFTPLP